MSHRATNWAIGQRGLKPAAKIVLWHLADAHNPHHGCFPRQDTLAEACEMSRSTVNLHLKALEDGGLIRRIQSRCEQTNRQKATRYLLGFEFDDAGLAAGGQTQDVVVPCPKTGHGNGADSVSETAPEPCPKNGQSRVRNSDSMNPVREPVRETGNQREDARENAEGAGNDQHPDVDGPSNGREEGRGGDTGASPDAPEPVADDRKALKALGKVHPQWPTYAADSRPATEKAFLACGATDRADGLALWRAYVDHVTGTLGRAKLCAMATYWRERRWQQLPGPIAERARAGVTEPPKGPPSARPFGPVWAAMRLAIASGAVVEAAPFKPTSFQQRLIDRGQATLEGLAIDRAVQRFDRDAEQGRSPTAPEWALALKDAMEPVPVASALQIAWRETFDARGWRWPPTPMDVVYLPKLLSPAPGRTDEEDLDAAVNRFAEALRAALPAGGKCRDADRQPLEPLNLP